MQLEPLKQELGMDSFIVSYCSRFWWSVECRWGAEIPYLDQIWGEGAVRTSWKVAAYPSTPAWHCSVQPCLVDWPFRDNFAFMDTFKTNTTLFLWWCPLSQYWWARGTDLNGGNRVLISASYLIENLCYRRWKTNKMDTVMMIPMIKISGIGNRP